MEIIATTNVGVIITATNEEVKEILTSVNGERPKELKIGQKIPAIDYGSTLTKLKNLKSDSTFRYMIKYEQEFHDTVKELITAVSQLSDIKDI